MISSAPRWTRTLRGTQIRTRSIDDPKLWPAAGSAGQFDRDKVPWRPAGNVVEPDGTDRARLIARVELRPSSLFRAAEPLMAAALRREVDANLSDLKGLLEAQAGAR